MNRSIHTFCDTLCQPRPRPTGLSDPGIKSLKPWAQMIAHVWLHFHLGSVLTYNSSEFKLACSTCCLEGIHSRQISTREEFSYIPQCRFMVPLLMGTYLMKTPTICIMAWAMGNPYILCHLVLWSFLSCVSESLPKKQYGPRKPIKCFLWHFSVLMLCLYLEIKAFRVIIQITSYWNPHIVNQNKSSFL